MPGRAIAHRGGADIERRQAREQMAADVAGDLMRAEFLLHEFHRRKDRPLGAADAEARRPRRHRLGELLDLRIGEHAGSVRRRRRIAEQTFSRAVRESLDAFGDDLRRIFAGHRQYVLAGDLGLDVAAAQDGVERLLDEFRLAFLDDQDRLLVQREVRRPRRRSAGR